MKNIILSIFVGFYTMTSAHSAIINGDFELGNSGFTSQYTLTGSNTTEGQYTVRSDPQNWNGAYFSMPDHTSGAGNMLVVNGAPDSNLIIWEQTLTITPSTNYNFSAWVSTAVAGGPADLIVKVNDSILGSSFIAPSNTGAWENMIRSWNSNNATLATIQIFDINTSTFPNDFYLDDLSLTAVSSVPLPATFWLLGSGLISLLSIGKWSRKLA